MHHAKLLVSCVQSWSRHSHQRCISTKWNPVPCWPSCKIRASSEGWHRAMSWTQLRRVMASRDFWWTLLQVSPPMRLCRIRCADWYVPFLDLAMFLPSFRGDRPQWPRREPCKFRRSWYFFCWLVKRSVVAVSARYRHCKSWSAEHKLPNLDWID